MYITYLHERLKNNLYKIKLDLHKKDKYIKKHNLKFIDNFKKYCIQNIEIIASKDLIKFNKVQYKMINLDKLIIEKIMNEYTKFSFYEVDYEEEYKEYSNYDLDINLREYNDYIIIEYQYNDINKISKNDINKIKI